MKLLCAHSRQKEGQTLEERQTARTCHAILLLLFSTKIVLTIEIFHYLNRVQFLQLAHTCDSQNRQCPINSVRKEGLTMRV